MQVERGLISRKGDEFLAANGWVTRGQPFLIPHVVTGRMAGEKSSNARWGGPAAYQLVGGVTAYRGDDG